MDTKLLGGVSLYFLITSTVEFVCAQSPYSMRGILGGLTYGMVGVHMLNYYFDRYNST